MPTASVVDEQPLRPAFPVRTDVPAAAKGPAVPPMADYVVRDDMANLRAGLGTREQIQDEIDDIASAMRGFYLKAPDEVLRECSAYSARLTEMCVLLHRVENLDRQYVRIRTQQAERYITELDRQWKTASRLIEVSRQDLQMVGGQV